MEKNMSMSSEERRAERKGMAREERAQKSWGRFPALTAREARHSPVTAGTGPADLELA